MLIPNNGKFNVKVDSFFSVDKSLDGVYRKVSGNFLSFSRFGFVEDDEENPRFFSLGEITAQMPNTGMARYEGKVAEAGTGKEGDWAHTKGTFVANVDFGAKTIQATLNNLGKGENEARGFSAKINGAEFLGTSGTGGIKGVAGKFYGANAEEIGGVYRELLMRFSQAHLVVKSNNCLF